MEGTAATPIVDGHPNDPLIYPGSSAWLLRSGCFGVAKGGTGAEWSQ